MADFDVPIEEQTLRGLEERLERATRAAERLLAEAAAEAGDGAPAAASDAGDGPGAGEVPASGWQHRGAARGDPTAGGWIDPGDAERLLAVLAAVLDRMPLELQQRLVAALRELLLALRALVDWCLQRAERRRAAPAEVQDIPIL